MKPLGIKNGIAIEALNLTKTFGNLTAVDNVGFQVRTGEIFGIVGPDGAGKTTTLRMLAGLMDPTLGTASIAGFDTRTAAADAKEHLAYMSQRFGLYPDLTVAENISFYADLYGVSRKGRRDRMNELLEFSHMQPFKKRKAGDLSGGMKQKLQLICALIHTPAVLLLDEPTNGVDPVSRRDFWTILHETVKQGVTILVTTSYMDETERCDRVALLDKGKLMVQGTPHDIRQQIRSRFMIRENGFKVDETGGMPAGPEDTRTAVRVDHLTRVFGSFTAVDAVSFDVPQGEIFGFLGPNGAGKSTTIRMLCGLLTPSSGKGVVAGYDIYTQAEEIKQHIGYMSQKFSLYEDLTVEENIEFYGGIYGLKGSAMKTRKTWAMEMAGLPDHGGSLTRILSTGWKQRLALACAILHEPPILFLDEPTSGVDPLSRRRFWDMIYDMAAHGVTVFVTTHHMEEAEYCNRIALIYKGRMIAMGTPMELKTRHMHDQILPSMEDVFIALIEEEDQIENNGSRKGDRP